MIFREIERYNTFLMNMEWPVLPKARGWSRLRRAIRQKNSLTALRRKKGGVKRETDAPTPVRETETGPGFGTLAPSAT